MILRHPPKRTLRLWVDGELVDQGVENHVGECERCASYLEGIGGTDEDSLQGLNDLLSLVLTAPDDLNRRLEVGVAARLDARQVARLVVDIFGAGVETSRILFTEDSNSKGS